MDQVIFEQLLTHVKTVINAGDLQSPLTYGSFAKILLVVCEYIDKMSSKNVSLVTLNHEAKHKLAIEWFLKIMKESVTISTESDKIIANLPPNTLRAIAEDLIPLYVDISKGLTSLNNLNEKLPDPVDTLIATDSKPPKKKRGFFSRK